MASTDPPAFWNAPRGVISDRIISLTEGSAAQAIESKASDLLAAGESHALGWTIGLRPVGI